MIADLKARAERAEEDRQKLLAQNKELLAQNREADKDRQKLMAQNQELKDKLEQHRQRMELRQSQEDQRRLAAFEKLLGVS